MKRRSHKRLLTKGRQRCQRARLTLVINLVDRIASKLSPQIEYDEYHKLDNHPLTIAPTRSGKAMNAFLFERLVGKSPSEVDTARTAPNP